MKPLLRFFKDFFAAKRILGDDDNLTGLLKADALLQALVTDGKIPGLAITVTRKEKVVFQKGYGLANREEDIRIDPKNSVFRIASVSKPIAALTLAKLVTDGKLKLDASLYGYVPYFPSKKYDFSIRQLAGHTAGIRAYKGKEYALNKPYSIKEGITVFEKDPLEFEPGTAYLYNSYDWCLLSLAMQEATGRPFEELVQESVLKPLDMKQTFPEIPAQNNGFNIPNKTTFYSRNRLGFRKAVPVHNFYKLAGGGYLSTSDDIAKLGKANYKEIGISEEVWHQFLTSVEIQGEPTYYGLGWQVSEDAKGRPYYGHVGNGVGGYANFYVYPNQEMVFSILINCTDPRVQLVLDEVIDALLSMEPT
ncbi:serine hydrolase domain-containing protein [Spongiimicrobium salis]|uniref:serine hydrolase domain-containing protein n=1 Tax=Spongiimicrobium salis TaxID=1667022 RepID=UPI00374CDA61